MIILPGREILKYLDIGKFDTYGFQMVIPALLADPSTPESKAVTMRVELDPAWAMIVFGFNWGGSSFPGKITYSIRTEQGSIRYKREIRESNLIQDTPFMVHEWIEIAMWNVSDPAEDVYVDFTMHYYTLLERNLRRLRE